MDREPIDLPAELLDEVRAVIGADSVEEFVRSAVERQLRDWEFVRILDELDAEAGPVPAETMAEAEAFWRAG